MQVFPSSTTPQRSVADQWTESPCLEECSDATDGVDPTRSTFDSRTSSCCGKHVLCWACEYLQVLVLGFCFSSYAEQVLVLLWKFGGCFLFNNIYLTWLITVIVYLPISLHLP